MKINFNNLQVYNSKNNNKITFGDRADVIYKSLHLCDTFAKAKLNNHKLNRKDIEKIIKKAFPKLSIKYWDKVTRGREGQFEPYNFAIHLLKSDLKSDKSLNNFLVLVIHELTHAYQELDKEMSRNTIISKYSKKHTVEEIKSIYNIIDKYVNQIVNETNLSTAKLRTTDKKEIAAALKEVPSIKEKIINHTQKILNKLKTSKKYNKEDMDFILKNLYIILINEYDAYKISNKLLPKLSKKIAVSEKVMIDLIKTACKTIEKEIYKGK